MKIVIRICGILRGTAIKRCPYVFFEVVCMIENYITVNALAEKWGLNPRTIQTMCADGKIEDSEMRAWALTSKICSLPTMSLGDAIEILGKL